MFASLKKHWQEFKKSRPGHRFQDRHARRQKEAQGSFNWKRWVNILAGIGIVLAGVVMLAVPGPGLPVAVMGLALLGSEFLVLAKFLDWAEVRLRKWWQKARSFWRRASTPVRVLLISLVLVAAAGVAYGAWVIVMR